MTTPEFAPGADEVQKALEIARNLIKAGVPVFAASPCPEGCPLTSKRKMKNETGKWEWIEKPHAGAPGRYHLPREWEKTVPSEVWLERWQPGWGLAAVGGHTVDFLDVDPRNGGADSYAEILNAGHAPTVLGMQRTPSGGTHRITHPTGDRKSVGFMPGLDMQAGDENGQGRGFVWIAPTVRPSKDPSDAGTLRAYRWEGEPDYAQIGEFSPGADPSLEGMRTRIEAYRNRDRRDESALPRPAPAQGAHDPFLTPGMTSGLAGLFGSVNGHWPYRDPGDRAFTQRQMLDFLAPFLENLQKAQIGSIEETCNIAAAALSHFVPEFWTVDQAMAILENRLAETAYDPNGPSDWEVSKFRDILDGYRPPADNWKATRKEEPPAPPSVTVEAQPGEETLSTYEKLRARMMTASQLAARRPPRPLVHGLLRLNTEAWLIGAPGSLKSFVALDLAGHVGRGQDWQGLGVEKKGVLYLAAEGEEGMTLRTRAWEKVNGEMEGVSFLPYPVQVKSADGQWDALVQIAAEDKPGLIIIDTQHRVSVGLEENSATDMGILIAAVGRLKRASGACVLVIHHTGRDGGNARGSSALDGAQDTELHVKRGEPRELLTARIIQDKQKDMAEAGGKDGLLVQFQVVDLGQDEETGEYLSSLVLRGDRDAVHAEMIARSGFTEVDVEPWKGKAAETWTKHFPEIPAQSTLKRRILQVLADHAHDRGLTQAEARRAVTARWYEKGRAPDADSWSDGWNVVTSLDIAVNIGGERWALDQAVLQPVIAQYGTD